jgi:putative ABC transport system permease protein
MSKRGLYLRLAASNIRSNRKFYLPYIFAGAGCSMMMYLMLFLIGSEVVSRSYGKSYIQSFLFSGTIVIAFFSLIVLLYANAFLMKRRKKEFGVFYVLGMEKRHLARVQLYETLISALLSIATGVICGVIFSKLAELLLCRIVRLDTAYGFSVSVDGIAITAAVFLDFYFVTLLYNLLQIGRAKPTELLKSGNVGQREPKSKALLALIGVVSLGAGYAIAILTESPLEAISMFLVAVILVIIGTYCLFTAGSIIVLKSLRRNTRYYYQPRHFTGVSGMLYRMKQNAVGLASICILSTMVLVTVSTTVALNVGSQDIINRRYPCDFAVTVVSSDSASTQTAFDFVRDLAREKGYEAENMHINEYIGINAALQGNEFVQDSVSYVFIVNQSSCGADLSDELAEGEVMVYSTAKDVGARFTLLGRSFDVVKTLDDYPIYGSITSVASDVVCVVASETDFDDLASRCSDEQDGTSVTDYEILFDLPNTDDAAKAEFEDALIEGFAYIPDGVKSAYIGFESRAEEESAVYSLYGSFLFLGLFLGTLFLMATILIIYYKQISEGYEDKERFEILQKVGMSQSEVRGTIRSQILTVFFLPLGVACLHIAVAFRIITKLLSALMLKNVRLYAACTLATIGVFALVYAVIYAITSREYYKIVRRV